MSNTILTDDIITKEAARILVDEQLGFINTINKQYDGSFAKSGAKIGDTLRLRLPARYDATVGTSFDMSSNISTHTEEKVDLKVDRVASVAIDFGSAEQSLDLDDFSERVLRPAMAQLATEMEVDVIGRTILKVPGLVCATANSAIWKDVASVGAYLDSQTTPRDGKRSFMIDPMTQVNVMANNNSLYVDGNDGGFVNGYVGKAAGFNFFTSNNMTSYATPATDVAGAVNDTYASGDADIDVDGFNGSEVIAAGTVFTIAGVYMLSPASKRNTGILFPFVAASAVTLSTGAGTITLVTPAVNSGASANVSALPANDAVITILGGAGKTLRQNCAYHRDAFAFATADIGEVDGAINARQQYKGISIALARQGAVKTRVNTVRLDILYGVANWRPEDACRLLEATT